MARNDGRFDGMSVEMYDGRFAGTFEMDQDLGESIAYDDVVSFFVVTTAGKVGIDATKSGDLKRTNTFEVDAVQFVPVNQASKILNDLGIVDPQLGLFEGPKDAPKDYEFDPEDSNEMIFSPGDDSPTAQSVPLPGSPKVDPRGELKDYMYGD